MNPFFKLLSFRQGLMALSIFIFPAQVFPVEVDATLQWVRTVPLSTAVSGVVDKVHVNKGDLVQVEQLLMSLVDRVFVADVASQKANLKKSENNRDEAQRELDRTQELYDRTLLSDHDLQLAKIQRDLAIAEWQTTRATLAKAELDNYYSAVRAPFDAWVLQRNVQPGQTVIVKLQASPLLVLAEAGRMLARATVGGETASKIKLGKKAKVTVAGKSYTGKVSFIAMEPLELGVDKYVLEVIFPSGKSMLRVGQTAKVSF